MDATFQLSSRPIKLHLRKLKKKQGRNVANNLFNSSMKQCRHIGWFLFIIGVSLIKNFVLFHLSEFYLDFGWRSIESLAWFIYLFLLYVLHQSFAFVFYHLFILLFPSDTLSSFLSFKFFPQKLWIESWKFPSRDSIGPQRNEAKPFLISKQFGERYYNGNNQDDFQRF